MSVMIIDCFRLIVSAFLRLFWHHPRALILARMGLLARLIAVHLLDYSLLSKLALVGRWVKSLGAAQRELLLGLGYSQKRHFVWKMTLVSDRHLTAFMISWKLNIIRVLKQRIVFIVFRAHMDQVVSTTQVSIWE